MINVTHIQLHSSTLLDFDKLMTYGWKHPKGLHGEVLRDSLVKQGKVHTYQIVRHFHKDETEYQEIIFHPKENYDKVLLKGKGGGLPADYEVMILGVLIEELSRCEK